MKQILPVCLLLLLTLTCCKKKDQPLRTDLTGTWQEEETTLQFAGSNARYTFSGNAFTLRLSLFSDMLPVNPADSCLPGYGHTEYIRGTYTATTAGVLTLTGTYSDPAFTTNVPNCNGATNFHSEHHYRFDGLKLILNPEQEAYYRIELHPE